MATIITKNSQTASAVPSAASLAVGELAVNTADGKLYTEHTGGVVKEIIPSTVVDGGITANKLASNAVTTAKIADANVTGAKLENSGVTAGTYTTATVTVDAKGRITSASSGSGGGVSSLNGQTGSVTTTSVDSIGATMLCIVGDASPNPGSGSVTNSYYAGTTIAGSSLRYGNFTGSGLSGVYAISGSFGYRTVSFPGGGSSGLTGTWRGMGAARVTGTYNPCTDRSEGTWIPSIFVRIS
jgi:hypothetical protein